MWYIPGVKGIFGGVIHVHVCNGQNTTTKEITLTLAWLEMFRVFGGSIGLPNITHRCMVRDLYSEVVRIFLHLGNFIEYPGILADLCLFVVLRLLFMKDV